jgi:hypothetical protein
LAIDDLPLEAAVLSPYANRVLALFEKRGGIKNQHALMVGENRSEAPPHTVGAPRCVCDEVLEGLVRAWFGHSRQHRFHRLARAVAEDSLNVPP